MSIIKNLIAAQSKYNKAVGDAESKIAGKVEFEFSIQYQYSDGWTIVSDDADVCPINYCLEIINKKGTLSKEDFVKGCI